MRARMIGTLLSNRYRIDATLGEGGMGVVYRAHDTLLDRPVAVKALSPHLFSAEGLSRLLREAQAAAKLTHPNIVGVHDVVEVDGQRLIVMEYVEGETLREKSPLPWPAAVDVARQVCAALEFAHRSGITHRDIKPENIILTRDGLAKVMDFGLARSEGRSRLTETGMIIGTVAYMAPEQALSGQADARSDLYSLGCVLYEMVTGRVPFEADDPISIISMHINVPPVAPRFHAPEIPAALESVIFRLLAKDPTARYTSAAELGAVLGTAFAPPEAPADTVAAVEAQPAGPSLLEMMVRGRLVGRDHELAALKGSLESMLSGAGHTVLVAGEPGIGKTRLAAELLVFARLRGCVTSLGRCYEQEVAIPYLAVGEALRGLVRELDDERLAALAGPHAAELVKVVPELTARMPAFQPSPALEPDQERLRLFEHVTVFLQSMAGVRPVVLLIDDLHWADAATLQLLRYVARNIRGDRILLLGTYRDVELDRTHPLGGVLRELNRERLFTRVLVRRLAPEHVAEMIGSILQTRQPVSGEFRDLIFRETEGNPFFVEEVLKHLAEAGALYLTEGRWERKQIGEIDVPQSVREVIRRRLDRLSGECVDVLTVASAIGREFDFDVLQAALSSNGELIHTDSPSAGSRLLDVLEEGLDSQLLTEERVTEGVRYNFVHSLVRETLYDGLSIRRKMLIHERIGEALERVYAQSLEDHAADLAHHFAQVGRSQAERVVRYALAAADRASQVYAHDEAAAFYRVARDMVARDDPQYADLTVRIGKTYIAQGRWREAAEALGEAYRAYAGRQDDRGRLDAALALASTYRQFPDPDTSLRWSAEAADIAQTRGDRAAAGRAVLRMANALWVKGAYPEAAARAQEARDAALASGDAKTAAVARIRLLSSRDPTAHPLSQGIREMREAVDEADRAGVTSVLARANLSTMLEQHGADVATTARIQEEALEICRRAGDLFGVAFSLSNLAGAEHDRGDWRRADELDLESIAMYERIGASFGAAYPRIWMATRTGLRGDATGAGATLRTLLGGVGEGRDVQGIRAIFEQMAELYLSSGQPEMALAALDEAVTLMGLPMDDPQVMYQFGTWRALALARTGHLAEAREFAETVERLCERTEAFRGLWLARAARGVIRSLQGDPGAEEDFSFAAEAFRHLPQPLLLGRTLREWGIALLREGTPESRARAQSLLNEAVAIFDRLGARLDAEQTRRFLES
ncbi:MAG: protein kinase domain-containing protein [bacterium]